MRSVLLFTLLAGAAPAFGSVIAPNLGVASTFGLLGGAISNTGTSVVEGNVGSMSTVTGFNSSAGTATGSVYTAAGTTAAYGDFLSAYAIAVNDYLTPPTQTPAGLTTDQTFDGNTVYKFSDTNVTSTSGIVLTFVGTSSDIFIIKVPSALVINGPITFDLTGGALAGNIYWIVGTDATIKPTVSITWDGNILAGSSFTMSHASGPAFAGTINGCVFAVNANTLAAATQVNGCAATGATPEPGSSVLVALGLLLGVFGLRKFAR